jgi:hypothetical protein
LTEAVQRSALFGLIFCLPALLLCTAGVLQTLFGVPDPLASLENTFRNVGVIPLLLHPIPLLAGLLAAGALNLARVLGISTSEGELIVRIRIRERMANFAIVLMSGSLLLVILAYSVTENFTITPR